MQLSLAIKSRIQGTLPQLRHGSVSLSSFSVLLAFALSTCQGKPHSPQVLSKRSSFKEFTFSSEIFTPAVYSSTMSACDSTLASPIRPSFEPRPNFAEPSSTQNLIAKLGLQKHPEGGYYVETDRDPLRIPNPFQSFDRSTSPHEPAEKENNSTRSASTTIYYLLTPGSPKGVFHRNKGRTIHTLHKGRGRYIIIHADETQKGQKARIETFVAGHDVHHGERLQWLVEGEKYKASFLLPDTEMSTETEGLLISEVIQKKKETLLSSKRSLLPEALLTLFYRPSCQASSSAIMTLCRPRYFLTWCLLSRRMNFTGCCQQTSD